MLLMKNMEFIGDSEHSKDFETSLWLQIYKVDKLVIYNFYFNQIPQLNPTILMLVGLFCKLEE